MTDTTATEDRAPRLTLPVFGCAIFVSAALLFAVQPMFTKMVLPQFGGAPAVWSVAMVFFQGALLAGYAYAHVLTRTLSTRAGVAVHLGLLVLAAFTLPLGIAEGWGRPPEAGQAPWLLGLFAASIGLPFFALSANGPLLQAWFARTGHKAAHDPYFLYAAANVGSFLALLAYPALLEPFTRLGQQTLVWSAGFLALIGLMGLSGALLLRSRNALPALADEVSAAASAPPSWRDIALWMALAAVPSALLIAVTAHLSTDVAAVPLLWVVPLALYLLTFTIVFQRRPLLPHRWMVAAQPALVVLLVAVLAAGLVNALLFTFAVNIAAFFVTAMVCHGELAQRRPPPRHLTAFYLAMSAGGVIGGVAAGIAAPQLFNWVAEYPILIVLALLCRPGLRWPATGERRAAWVGAAWAGAAVLLLGAAAAPALLGHDLDARAYQVAIGVLAALAFIVQQHVLRLTAMVATALVVVHLYGPDGGSQETVRSFFGVHRIVESEDGRYRSLMHGTTAHGAQRIRGSDGEPLKDRPEPLTYYYAASPMGAAITALRARKALALEPPADAGDKVSEAVPMRIAVVGLGTGSLACYAQPADEIHIFEIDPAVVRIARDPARFTFVSACAPGARIVLGDARLTLAEGGDGLFDVLVVDAFSSDAIPVHLLTREAMGIYLRKLRPGGLVLMHVSNRHMELASVVAGVAAANGAVSRLNDSVGSDESDEEYRYGSTVVAVARTAADLGVLPENEWEPQSPDPAQWVWTDDYSNIVGAVIRRLRGG